MSKVSHIAGRNVWAGEPMDPDEIEDMVQPLEAVIADIKKGKWRGFVFAAVDQGGVGADYHIIVRQKTGCSTLGLIGATNLARYEVEALSSDVVAHEEDDD